MPDKDPYQQHVDSHFKDIHVSRPAPKPISSWTEAELGAGADRQRAKKDEANKIQTNPNSSVDAKIAAGNAWQAAEDSSRVIERENIPRVYKKLIQMNEEEKKYGSKYPITTRNKPRPV